MKREHIIVNDMIIYSKKNHVSIDNKYVLMAINKMYKNNYKKIYKTTKQEESKFFPDYCIDSKKLDINKLFVEETRVYGNPINKKLEIKT